MPWPMPVCAQSHPLRLDPSPALLVGCALLAFLTSAAPASGATYSADPLAGWVTLAPEPDGRTPFAVHGWAVADCSDSAGDAQVAVLVDGRELFRRRPWLPHPGVTERFPHVEGSDRAGFWTEVDPARLEPGEHRLEVRLLGCGTESTLLDRSFRAEAPLAPFLAIPALAALLLLLPAGAGYLLARVPPADSTLHRGPTVVLVAVVLAAAATAALLAAHLGPRLGWTVVAAGEPWHALARWDGRAYLDLARNGWETPQSWAWFPLYPLLLKTLAWLPHAAVPTAAGFANLALFVLALRRWRTAAGQRAEGEEELVGCGGWPWLLLAASPFSLFFVTVYGESLFLFLAVGYAAAVAKRRPALAALCGVLAGLTRVTAAALPLLGLGLLIGIEGGVERGRRPSATHLAAVLAPLAGLGAWCLVQWLTVGDPVAFLHAQEQFGRANTFSPGRLVAQLLGAPGRAGNGLAELGSLAVVLAGAAGLCWTGRVGQGLYSAAVVLMPLVTVRTVSLNRYSLLAFPALLFLFERLPRRLRPVLLAVGLALLLYQASRFGRQLWVG